jgi:hypothetical protein
VGGRAPCGGGGCCLTEGWGGNDIPNICKCGLGVERAGRWHVKCSMYGEKNARRRGVESFQGHSKEPKGSKNG